MASVGLNDSQGQREDLLRRVLELLPNMVFAKDGSTEARDDYDRGFRCVHLVLALRVCAWINQSIGTTVAIN
jgi:hypothetical protein